MTTRQHVWQAVQIVNNVILWGNVVRVLENRIRVLHARILVF